MILPVIILKIVSLRLQDLPLRAAWAGHWLLSRQPAKETLTDKLWKETIFKKGFNVYTYIQCAKIHQIWAKYEEISQFNCKIHPIFRICFGI